MINFQEPHLYRPSSQLVTRRQLNQQPARRWCQEMQVPLSITRKTWERVFILQSLFSRGMIRPGARGLGFGVGRDPMIPVMINFGCQLVATDYGDTEFAGWGPGLDLNPRGVADAEAMKRQVQVRDVDMNDIPADLNGFDFVYSCGSLEHIGGLQHGLDFIESAMSSLRPGGIAVHTTELNLSGGEKTLDLPNLGFYLPASIDALIDRLNAAGHIAPAMNYFQGTRFEDGHIAERPFPPPCLKVRHSGYIVTSLGLIIEAAPAPRSRLSASPSATAIREFATDAAHAVARRTRAKVNQSVRRHDDVS